MRKQRDSNLLTDRDRTWAQQAAKWAHGKVPEYFDTIGVSGLHTVADVLKWLDGRDDVPTAWARWLGHYPTRYQMVRNACVSMARQGNLQLGTTVNAKDVDAIAYTRAEPTPDWHIEVVPANQSSRVNALVRGWIIANASELAGVTSIEITHRKQNSHAVRVRGGGGSAG